MKLKIIFLGSISIFLVTILKANNISISNAGLSGQNVAQDFKLIDFDISWDNSRKINGTPPNWYLDGTGSGDGHTEPANCNISSSDDTGNGGANGVFIHRTDLGQGTVNFTGVKLRWDYGVDGVEDGDNVEFQHLVGEVVDRHLSINSFIIVFNSSSYSVKKN